MTGFVAGGWWWVRRLVVTGAVHVRGTVYETAPAFEPHPWAWFSGEFFPGMLEGWWASFVWAGTPLTYPRVLVPAAVLGAGVVAAAVVRPPARDGGGAGAPAAWEAAGGGRRAAAWLLATPTALLLGLTAWAAYTTYARTGLAAGIQGRYLFGGFAGLVAVAAQATRRCSDGGLAGCRPPSWSGARLCRSCPLTTC